MMKEYWVNVYEYETVKNTQFHSHCVTSVTEANFRATMRKIARPEVVYRIHVKMKPVKPKYEYFNDGCIRHM